jgi:aspartate racemase
MELGVTRSDRGEMMRRLGLLGGMSFEATAVYYRDINEAVRERLGELHSAEMLMYSVDFQNIVEKQRSGRWDDAGQQLAEVARRLEAAGADGIVICAVTMHLVADAIEKAVAIPLIHVVDETAHRLGADGHARPLLIATRYTMEGEFYSARMNTYGVDVMVPEATERDEIQRIIFEELCAGKVLDSSRRYLESVIEQAKAKGADSVIFGCTEICLILDPAALTLPVFDSNAIHVEAAVEFALGATA